MLEVLATIWVLALIYVIADFNDYQQDPDRNMAKGHHLRAVFATMYVIWGIIWVLFKIVSLLFKEGCH